MDAIQALGLITGVGSLFSDDSAKQQTYSLELMKKQHEYNTQAAQQQEAASLRMFENTGYAARVRQLKNAGLNPGLIYGMGAGSGGGVTGNITAPNVGLPSAPNVPSAREAKTRQIGMALELAKIQSEIEVNKSVAEVNRAESTLKSGPTTEKISQEVLNLKTTREGQELANYSQKIQNAINTATTPAQINRINYMAEEAGEALAILRNNREISDATKKMAIDQTAATLKKTLTETIKLNSETKVANETATKIVNEIEQRWKEIGQNNQRMQIEIMRILYDNEVKMNEAVLHAWTQLGTNIFQTIHKTGINTLGEYIDKNIIK